MYKKLQVHFQTRYTIPYKLRRIIILYAKKLQVHFKRGILTYTSCAKDNLELVRLIYLQSKVRYVHEHEYVSRIFNSGLIYLVVDLELCA